jgi:hypothetical protein
MTSQADGEPARDGKADPTTRAQSATTWRLALGWVALLIIEIFGLPWWQEALSFNGLQAALVANAAIAFGLLLWCLWRLIRSPKSEWVGLTLLIAAATSSVPLAAPLYFSGAYLKLVVMRPTYEALRADAAAGKLNTGKRFVYGSARGVRFFFDSPNPGAITFPWSETPYGGFVGVEYDPEDCPRRPEPPLIAPTTADAGEPPQMQGRGRMGEVHPLSGHYCAISFVGM